MAEVRRNARGEATEKEILEATFHHVQKYGYDKTTIGGIVKATGKPASSIYWLFGSKDGLITKALESSYPHATVAQLWEGVTPDNEPTAQLGRLMGEVMAKNSREESVRVGIMLALEGSAAALGVQEPFVSRRRAALTQSQRWWCDYLTHVGLDSGRSASERDLAGLRLAYLAMWWIDGHYVGDRDHTGSEAKARAALLAHALCIIAATDFPWAGPAECPETAFLSPAASEEDNLLQVTRQLVSAYGYEGATIARICDASRLRRSSVYWRYKDKDELVHAAVSHQFLDALGRLDRLPAVSPGAGPKEVARILSADLCDLQARADVDPELMRAGMLMAIQRWEPPTLGGEEIKLGSRDIDRHLAGWLQAWPGVNVQGPTADSAAWLFTRLRMGMIVSHLLGDTPPYFTKETAYEAVIALLTRR